jgi:HEAT repeat protein
MAAISQDPSELVQCRALESVSYSSREGIAPLIEQAFTTGGHAKMASALIAMGRSMDSRWEKIVLQMLNSKIPALRAEAARAAGEIQIGESIPTLVELTEDSEQVVRFAAIWSLSEIGGDQARHTLEQLFRESEDDHEADFIESALDNVAFTDGMQPLSLFDFPEDETEDELLEMLISQEINDQSGDNGGFDPNDDEEQGDNFAHDDLMDEDEGL